MNRSLRFILPAALLFFLACRQNPQVQMPPAEDCNLTYSYLSDTNQLNDFNYSFVARTGFASKIKQWDSMYCFRVRSGWGQSDFLAAVYADSGKYYAQYGGWANDFEGKPNPGFEEKIRQLTSLEWASIRHHFYASNFWCQTFEDDGSGSCYDCSFFCLWGRESKRYRMVTWQDGQTLMVKPKELANVLQQVCGFPEYQGCASYKKSGDSVRFHVFVYGHGYPYPHEPFTYSFNGKPLPKKDGSAQLTLAQKDFEQVYKVIITETKPDSTIRRFTVERLLGGD